MLKSGIFFHEREVSICLGSVGNFGQCQVYVLIRAAANVESAWGRGSQGIFYPAVARSIAGTTAVIFSLNCTAVPQAQPTLPAAPHLPQR